MEENKMGVMPVNKLLISMALPMMISMLVQALYNIVDSMFVAQISENALTAVSLAFPAQNLMIAVGTGTGVGINALVSRSLGERNGERANLIANNGLLLYVLSGIVFALFGIFGSRLFFRAQTSDLEIVELGTQYLRICCLLSTAIFLQFGFERILQATGRTIYTMLTQGLGAIINAAIEALRNSEKYSAGMIEEFTLRRDVLLEEVAKIKTITVDAPQGTFYAMLNIKSTGLKSEEFAYALLEKEQVAVVPGITYGDCCEDFIRIAFTLDIYKIKEGIQRLKRFVESL